MDLWFCRRVWQRKATHLMASGKKNERAKNQERAQGQEHTLPGSAAVIALVSRSHLLVAVSGKLIKASVH